MKRILLLALFLGSASMSKAQCDDVFISEYIEGSGNDKALELYNPTSSPITLDGYTLERFSNGATTSSAGGVLSLDGYTIQPYGTLVIVNGQTTVQNGGSSPAVSPALQAMADVLDNPYPAVTYMNGNDAIVLFKSNSTVVVDIFGKVGEDPGQGWTDDASAGYTDANNGTWWTKDQTLIRKASVLRGQTDVNITEFNATVEWDSLPQNTWTELGDHVCDCESSSINENQANNDQIFVFPNPVVDNNFRVRATNNIMKLEVFDITGKVVLTEQAARGAAFIEVTMTDNPSGIYFVRTTLANGNILTQKVILK